MVVGSVSRHGGGRRGEYNRGRAHHKWSTANPTERCWQAPEGGSSVGANHNSGKHVPNFVRERPVHANRVAGSEPVQQTPVQRRRVARRGVGNTGRAEGRALVHSLAVGGSRAGRQVSGRPPPPPLQAGLPSRIPHEQTWAHHYHTHHHHIRSSAYYDIDADTTSCYLFDDFFRFRCFSIFQSPLRAKDDASARRR